MKMLNLFLISLLVLTVSNTTYAEEPMPYGKKAPEYIGVDGATDPNGNGVVNANSSTTTEAGYTKPGKNPSEQVPICEHCQDQNLFLTQVKKIAPKYVPKPSDSPASNVKSGQ